jgi:hypothetical protein
MLFVVFAEWKAQDVEKVVELGHKNTPPKEINFLAQATLFGQHKLVSIVDAPDEKTIFKWMVPFLQIMTFKAVPAMSPRAARILSSGK